MTNDETTKLAEIVAETVSQLKPDEIRLYLYGFVSTHPGPLVHAVNLLVMDDERYKDAVHRMHAWDACHPEDLVSWLHVSPATETSMRIAASWASAPLASRNLTHESTARWAGRALLNKNGVALYVYNSTTPWPSDEIEGLIAAAYQQPRKGSNHYGGIVLCPDGKVIEGLRTWPRE